MLNLEKRIDLERRNRKPSEITELNLDNSKATEIEGLTDEFTALRHLSLNNVGLQSLKGLPSLPALERLELSDNRLSGALHLLESCPHIRVLNLSGNHLREIEALRPLIKLSALQMLDLFSCEVTKCEDYREKVFELLPQLHYLDGFDRENEECPDDEDDDDDNASSGEDELADEDEAAEQLALIDDEDDEEDLEEEGDDVSEDEEEVGLDYLNQPDVEDDDEDFEPEANGEDLDDDGDSEIEDDEDESSCKEDRRGVKRKIVDDLGEENSLSNGPSSDIAAASAAGDDSCSNA